MTRRPSEIVEIEPDAAQVSCDGGLGPLGHPQVWYAFEGRDKITCMYCDQTFVRKQATRA